MPAITRAAPVQPPPPPPAPPQPEPLYVFLKPEIDQGLVTVLGDHAMPIVRIRNTRHVRVRQRHRRADLLHLLERIGEALKAEKGPVHGGSATPTTSRSTPCSSRPTSSFRRRAPRRRGRSSCKALGDPGRVTAQGHADADPIASNATAEGRDQNRRIEVVLRRQG